MSRSLITYAATEVHNLVKGKSLICRKLCLDRAMPLGQETCRLMHGAFTEQAAECLAKGQDKYNAGDRMGALKFFEQSLKKVHHYDVFWYAAMGC